LGDVPIDARCAEALRQRCPFLEADAWAQRGEHAIEVLIPFLQRLGPPDLTVVPIVMGAEDETELAQLAQGLAQVARMSEERCLFLASADLSHYEPHSRAAEQDGALIERICALDGAGLMQTAREGGVLMCGAGAVTCVLEAAKALGASRGTLVRYGTSAETDGDPHAVVGYAGIVIC
jgi:AmmeMemoRadiSam system protein B